MFGTLRVCLNLVLLDLRAPVLVRIPLLERLAGVEMRRRAEDLRPLRVARADVRTQTNVVSRRVLVARIHTSEAEKHPRRLQVVEE